MKKELEELVEKYNLVSRTNNLFWENYDNYILEEPTESAEYGLVDRDSVETKLYGYSYVISKQSERDYIKVEIEFTPKNQNAPLGNYWCIFDVNGEFIDDYFVIH